jgi:hypothetical protein
MHIGLRYLPPPATRFVYLCNIGGVFKLPRTFSLLYTQFSIKRYSIIASEFKIFMKHQMFMVRINLKPRINIYRKNSVTYNKSRLCARRWFQVWNATRLYVRFIWRVCALVDAYNRQIITLLLIRTIFIVAIDTLKVFLAHFQNIFDLFWMLFFLSIIDNWYFWDW